jgi:hypothetical protein
MICYITYLLMSTETMRFVDQRLAWVHETLDAHFILGQLSNLYYSILLIDGDDVMWTDM